MHGDFSIEHLLLLAPFDNRSLKRVLLSKCYISSYVLILFTGNEQKTEVQKDTLDPVWNQVNHLLLEKKIVSVFFSSNIEKFSSKILSFHSRVQRPFFNGNYSLPNN